ncbi:hypothetical protein TPHA_0D00640 [Tetrapisispora phaffii CBS 4417]|uniref:Threonylcarbamoyl-AMP synthase n=1 Tax=Tetrapisispora phaffii (strain ATCC 24235 / CBS 4417 / NBRC 1672 / NRRL Y-8282 / UCD 70-5) TaxID=1071381 RepID=G8BS87_TETPH|nr:hypothetical protein TPHA_0D00640 [Tetrapisispora phaffii CBS 4417]CCE62708.1 hypothetical protein TPHA_0D00640 [Tetrapisispora phaffii CBS 4417]
MKIKKSLQLIMSYHTRILKVDPSSIKFSPTAHIDGSLPEITDPATREALLEAARIIKDTDDNVAFPTETVYGLGGSALNDKSVSNIYKAKNRPSDNPLITHISSIDQLNRKIYNNKQSESQLQDTYQHIPLSYHSLISKLWPGPLTILLPVPDKNDNTLSELTTVGQPTFAVRIPSNPIARALIALSDTPIAAPSANASTRPSPTLAEHVYHDLNTKLPLILDGGPCSVGVESTVVDGLSTPPLLLRPGGFTYEQIVELGGSEWTDCKIENRKTLAKGEVVRTPGMKYKHYSPSATVALLIPEKKSQDSSKYFIKINELIADECNKNNIKKVAVLTSIELNKKKSDLLTNLNELELKDKPEIILKTLGLNGEEIQMNLFALLREVDELDKVDLIIVEGMTEDREGLAVMNRLKKAAGENHYYI